MEEGDAVQTGNTAFAPHPAPTYRYVVSSKADKLNILLEDRASKKQWSTGYLDEDAYLTGTNRILNATATDYVSVFQGALDYMMGLSNDNDCGDDSSYGSEDEDDEDGKPVGADQDMSEIDPQKLRRQLTLLENDVLQLRLSVKVRVHDSAWSAKYLFRLEPVSLERIDILESRIQDLEEELAATKKMMVEQQDEKWVTAKALKPALISEEGEVLWASTEGAELKRGGYEINIGVTGLYIVTVKVHLERQNDASGGGVEVELRVNDECAQSDHVSSCGKCSASLMLTTRLFITDGLTVVVTNAPSNVEASLTAARIGV